MTQPPDLRTNAAVDHLPTREGYDRWAAIYDGEDNPLVALEAPHVARLLGDVAGLSIVDLGCGTGRHALELARAGARVVALDDSPGMLERARQKPGASAVRFVAHDLARPLPFDDATFDGAISCLVLDHVADLGHFFRETRRVLRPRGFAVVSVMHPALMLRGVQARFTDPVTGRETRPASVANTISDYVGAALRSGFVLDQISEHAADEALAARHPRAEKYVGWPMLFLMRLSRGA
jgi:malonyl-CoA O-methyltransferase